MKKQRGTTTTGQLRLRTYKRFSDVPPKIVAQILANLGLPGGKMRRRALRHDPRTVIAFEATQFHFAVWWPVAWLTLGPVNVSKPRLRYIQLFVQEKHRRRGLGSRLMALCRSRWLRSGENVMVSTTNKGVAKFYAKNGIK